MLQITIPAVEQWDERAQEFVNTKEQTLCLEHSLVSLSKWESKWHKCFLKSSKLDPEKTYEETLDYVKCMTITQNVDPKTYACLTRKNFEDINAYIEDPMTATYFPDKKVQGVSRDKITAELIYYWMISLGIPFECQKWHLNRLFALIKVCGIKNAPPKKMSRSELMARNSALNAQRRARLGSRG